VIYFHPPASQREPLQLDVEVAFRGGWLSEFYPAADPTAPGLEQMQLSGDTVGRLKWQDLLVGTKGTGPETDAPVWLEPRDVSAAPVTTRDGESEKYLFYRGIGEFDAPLRVVTDEATGTLSIHDQFGESLAGHSAVVPQLWLVEVRGNGALAFRTLDAITVGTGSHAALAQVSARFADHEFSTANFDSLRASMHTALVADGLYADEADAMLDTWRHAYFASPGLRLFFLVPQEWTDHRLPLTISQPAAVDRVMMARIEIVSPRQRELVRQIAQAPEVDAGWVWTIPESESRTRFFAGRPDFGKLDVAMPANYQAYLALGRFRNAILLAEERRSPTESLAKFIETYGLRGGIMPTPQSNE
jgi:hypothetical protein